MFLERIKSIRMLRWMCSSYWVMVRYFRYSRRIHFSRRTDWVLRRTLSDGEIPWWVWIIKEPNNYLRKKNWRITWGWVDERFWYKCEIHHCKETRGSSDCGLSYSNNDFQHGTSSDKENDLKMVQGPFDHWLFSPISSWLELLQRKIWKHHS